MVVICFIPSSPLVHLAQYCCHGPEVALQGVRQEFLSALPEDGHTRGLLLSNVCKGLPPLCLETAFQMYAIHASCNGVLTHKLLNKRDVKNLIRGNR